MGCCGSKNQILQVGGEQVRLRNVNETFQYVRFTLSLRPDTPGVGETLVKALRQVGNDISPALEQEYITRLSEMFELFCATKIKSGGCCC